jgi:hypothetical protein
MNLNSKIKIFLVCAFLGICHTHPNLLLSVDAETRKGLIGTTSVVWNLTPEQAEKIDPLLSETQVKVESLTKEIIKIRHQMDQLFLQPLPDRKTILADQDKVDEALDEIRQVQWKLALAQRAWDSESI